MAFTWIPYYKELAQKLVQYRNKREELLNIIRGLDREYIDFLHKDKDGTKITDIHPFAVYSIFSRLTITEKKQKILEYFKKAFNLISEIPTDFDGIPSVDPRNSFWGMPWNDDAKKEIEENWDLFCCAINDNFDKDEFCTCFNKVLNEQGAKWNVTQALFRMNPDKFISLDGSSREYMKELKLPVFQEKELSGNIYLTYINKVESKIKNNLIKEQNFNELSYNAWLYGQNNKKNWLLSWNPYKWDWTNYEDWAEKTKKGIKFHEDWRCSNSHAKKGEEFFLVRTGVEPKGIIAHGYLTSDSFVDEENTRRVGIEFDYILNSKNERLLSMTLLKQECPNQEWNPQSSGIEIKKEYMNKLHSLWNKVTVGGNMTNSNYVELLTFNKNLILHGAPGTGKTHLAKEIAAQMICGKSFADIERGSEDEKAFNEQTEFVQFHPSYDYSDFVEGLRPVEGDDGQVGFERKDGVFKEFCERALKKSSSSEESNFDDCWDALIDYVRENLASSKLTKIGSWDYGLSSKESLKYSSVNSPSQYNFTITKQNVYDAYQGKKARPKGGFQKEMNQIVDFMKENFKLIPFDKNAKNEIDNKPYIFIIDEINRGELSKIFGELFFSIEPSYRGPKGKVRTQYANMMKESNSFDDELNSSTFGNFFIPDNVYIIGTMNDIDRSVESMDFAMRRRFVFEEVTAEDSAKNMNLPQEAIDRMTSINDVIHETEGLGDAYKIGGAYFLGVDDFDLLWKIKLSSLIKEYLRGIDDDGTKFTKIEEAYFGKLIDSSFDEDTESTSSNGNV